VLAVNSDPQAPVFDGADIGIVGDWQQAARLLTEALAREFARGNQARAGAAPRS
jgi:electron transfer flavoprotein alpha subunit